MIGLLQHEFNLDDLHDSTIEILMMTWWSDDWLAFLVVKMESTLVTLRLLVEVWMLFSIVQRVIISLGADSWWWGRSWQLQTYNSWWRYNFRTAQLFLDQANQNIFNWTHFSAHYTEEERVRLKGLVNGQSIVPRICPTMNLLGQQIFCYHCLEIIKRVSFRFHGLLRSHIYLVE